MSKRHIPASLRRKVAEQAEYRCGYCQTAQAYSGVQLHVEHIIPLAAGGRTIESNLWLACALCNSYKGARTHGIDPTTSQSIPLYNPRVQNWFDHLPGVIMVCPSSVKLPAGVQPLPRFNSITIMSLRLARIGSGSDGTLPLNR